MENKQPFQQPSLTTEPGLPSPSAILREAWIIYKKKIKTFLGIMLIPVVVSLAFSLLLFGAMGLSAPDGFEIGLGLSITFGIIATVVSIILYTWAQIALIYAIREEISVKGAYLRAKQKLVSCWWVSFLVGLITVGGVIFLIVPGLIFAIWFSFAVFVLIEEDLKGMDALLKSKKYVTGRWGSVAWRIGFMGLIVMGIAIIMNIVIGILGFSSDSGLLNTLISLVVTPLVMTYTFLLYSYAKKTRENLSFVPSSRNKSLFLIVGVLGTIIMAFFLLSQIAAFISYRENIKNFMQSSDTKILQLELELYYRNHEEYPASLEELSSCMRGSDICKDPSTGKLYLYKAKEEGENYSLCAESIDGKKECISSEF